MYRAWVVFTVGARITRQGQAALATAASSGPRLAAARLAERPALQALRRARPRATLMGYGLLWLHGAAAGPLPQSVLRAPRRTARHGPASHRAARPGLPGLACGLVPSASPGVGRRIANQRLPVRRVRRSEAALDRLQRRVQVPPLSHGRCNLQSSSPYRSRTCPAAAWASPAASHAARARSQAAPTARLGGCTGSGSPGPSPGDRGNGFLREVCGILQGPALRQRRPLRHPASRP